MSLHWSDDWLTVYQGDCREVMRSMEPESVHCVVTSPPYWGLRDYGTAGQLGLEPTPEEYVANMVAVFREVKRVLRADGTVWLNLGDSYASDMKGSGGTGRSTLGQTGNGMSPEAQLRSQQRQAMTPRSFEHGLKAKDLVGIPWRVAFALQADGWYLRSDIIWSKPNPMPESVTDRPTKSHEYLFLLSKSPRYYFDADAVREPPVPHNPATPRSAKNLASVEAYPGVREFTGNMKAGGIIETNPAGRNLRSVWTIATQPYPGAHFATFPRKLVEPCIKAGTSERGVCPECGAPWVRVVERTWGESERPARGKALSSPRNDGSAWNENGGRGFMPVVVGTTGWRPSCRHLLGQQPDPGTSVEALTTRDQPIPATVLDPFAGSGTTALVAQSLGRRAILIDLSTDYLDQIMARNAQMPLPA